MARKPNAVAMLPPWQSWLVVLVGGLILALVDVLTRSSIILYLAVVEGTLVAASVFKYGRFSGQKSFRRTLAYSVVMCLLSSVWAGACRCGFCLLLCAAADLRLCNYCTPPFGGVIISDVGFGSLFGGILLSFTLGKQSLSEGTRRG